MNIKTCSLRIVVNPQGEPTLQFRARRLVIGVSGVMDAGWYEWETVPVIDDIDARTSGGRHTCKQIYSGASGCDTTDGKSKAKPSLTDSQCDGLNAAFLRPGCGLWTV